MKELTKEQRYALAGTLRGILGADITPDEEDALEQAIRIVSPEFAADMDADEREFAKIIERDLRENPIPSPNGKVIRFGQEKKK